MVNRQQMLEATCYDTTSNPRLTNSLNSSQQEIENKSVSSEHDFSSTLDPTGMSTSFDDEISKSEFPFYMHLTQSIFFQNFHKFDSSSSPNIKTTIFIKDYNGVSHQYKAQTNTTMSDIELFIHNQMKYNTGTFYITHYSKICNNQILSTLLLSCQDQWFDLQLNQRLLGGARLEKKKIPPKRTRTANKLKKSTKIKKIEMHNSDDESSASSLSINTIANSIPISSSTIESTNTVITDSQRTDKREINPTKASVRSTLPNFIGKRMPDPTRDEYIRRTLIENENLQNPDTTIYPTNIVKQTKIVFSITNNNTTYTFAARHGQLVQSLVEFMEIACQMNGFLHIFGPLCPLLNTIAVEKLPSRDLSYHTDSTAQNNMSQFEMPEIKEYQTSGRIGVLNVHGLKSCYAAVLSLLDTYDIGILIALETMQKDKSNLCPGFIHMTNDVSKDPNVHITHHGTAIAINPKVYPNAKSIVHISNATSVRLEMKIGIYLPNNNKLQALQKILTNVTPNSILFGDLNINVEEPRSNEEQE